MSDKKSILIRLDKELHSLIIKYCYDNAISCQKFVSNLIKTKLEEK